MVSNNLTHSDKTVSGYEVFKCAQTYLETPYVDYGRTKGYALDCIGLPILVGQELGLFTGDFDKYSPTPKKRHAEWMADIHMGEIVWERPGWPDDPVWDADQVQPVATQPGDVGLFWFSMRSEPQHFGIFGVHPHYGPEQPTMIHAHSRYNKCVEQSVDLFWKRRLVKTYRLPNVKG